MMAMKAWVMTMTMHVEIPQFLYIDKVFGVSVVMQRQLNAVACRLRDALIE